MAKVEFNFYTQEASLTSVNKKAAVSFSKPAEATGNVKYFNWALTPITEDFEFSADNASTYPAPVHLFSGNTFEFYPPFLRQLPDNTNQTVEYSSKDPHRYNTTQTLFFTEQSNGTYVCGKRADNQPLLYIKKVEGRWVLTSDPNLSTVKETSSDVCFYTRDTDANIGENFKNYRFYRNRNAVSNSEMMEFPSEVSNIYDFGNNFSQTIYMIFGGDDGAGNYWTSQVLPFTLSVVDKSIPESFTISFYPEREDFLILNSYTDKYIPLKARQEGSDQDVLPNLLYFSYSEIPANFEFSESQEGYTGYSILQGAQDDWGILLEEGKGIRVGIPFVEKHKQQFNYTFSGNTNGSWANRTNGVYTLEDENAVGSYRRWRHPEGTYIKWVEKRWVMTFNPNMTTLPGDFSWVENQIPAYTDEQPNANAKDLSTLRWNTNGTYWNNEISANSSHLELSGQKTVWLVLGKYTQFPDGTKKYVTSNVVSFTLSTQTNEITNTLFEVTGPTGNKNYAGFYIDEEKRFYPTSLVNVQYSASCPIELRAKCSLLTIDGINFRTPYTQEGLVRGSGKLSFYPLASPDALITMTMTFQDKAGNKIELSQAITIITRLWRMIGTRIKEDDASYQTRFFSVSANSTMNEIPKSKTSSDEFSRQWEDIFYPATHGYPLGNDGKIDYQEALRISKDIDETGVNGPTTEELTRYDQLQLTNDRTALATDSDDRYMTSGWQRNKVYTRMESSSYGESGENLRYWIIDNEGYSDLALEFEYFDLDNQISNIPPNILSPYDGDVLVVYDAQAEGCLEESVDIFGKKSYRIKDSSLLVELFAFTGSCYTGDIRMQSGAALPITQTGNGFITSNITTTSKICIILYSDNDYQASGFKIKAGPRHNVVLSNYDLNETSGEVWIHQEPGTAMNRWYSPSKVNSTHQYMTSNVSFDVENGVLILDTRSGATITGDFTVYNYLYRDGKTEIPKAYFSYSNISTGTTSNPELKNFLLYNDDCVDYYEISMSVVPTGIVPDYSNIYSFQNSAQNFGRIVSNFSANKDKGTISFSNTVPLGRIFASYTYHSYYRLTNDGYGDLLFYDNALVPSSDYSTTGLKDWTYVDLMIYNEGSNSLSDGVMKFMSRGYIESSGSSQTVTQVVDENRPWDVQSGTIAETVNRTGANFNVSYTGLTAKTRGAAVTAINNTSSGGVSFGQTMLPRSKAYIRVYWCLAQNDSNSPSYVTTTRGQKLWSSELSGRYFVVTV